MVYNRWQERTVRREAQRAFGSQHDDVLLTEDRREPILESPREPAPEPRRPTAYRGAVPADKVDYIMQLTLPVAKPAAVVLEAWSAVQQRFAGRALIDTGDAPQTTQLRTALQLVGRNGVVSDAELIEFRSMVETMATQLAAGVSAPEMRAALESARELDRICADADIQIALHVIGIGTAPAEFPDQPFQSARRDDGVTLTLDVARIAEPARSYEAMARAGRELASVRGGRVVDDTGRELDERALAAIGRQLDAISKRLADCGIEPGSALALRLFS